MNTEDKKLIAKEKRKKYYLDNKDKINARNNENYRKNKELVLLRHKKRLENKDIALKDKERQRQYRLDDPEKQKIKSNNYYKNNQSIVLAGARKRQASVLNRTPIWLNNIDLFEIECIYIYAKSLNNIGLNYHVDHIIPLRGKEVSGLHIGSNLQVIPAIDNLMKSNKF